MKEWRVEREEWAENDEVDEKEWGVVRRLEKNWRLFRDGGHIVKESRKERKRKQVSEPGDKS